MFRLNGYIGIILEWICVNLFIYILGGDYCMQTEIFHIHKKPLGVSKTQADNIRMNWWRAPGKGNRSFNCIKPELQHFSHIDTEATLVKLCLVNKFRVTHSLLHSHTRLHKNTHPCTHQHTDTHVFIHTHTIYMCTRVKLLSDNILSVPATEQWLREKERE